MFTIITEQHECVQGSGEFCAYILKEESERFFSTEDIEYLINSPKLFKNEPECTLILTWDRNSQEAPELGPKMNKEILSDLHVRNVDQDLIFEHKKEDKKIPICTIPLTDWVEAIEHLNQPAEQNRIDLNP